jgi:hypothetical protein
MQKVRWPEKTAGSVDFLAGAASFYLDFLFLFHQGKRKKKRKEKKYFWIRYQT